MSFIVKKILIPLIIVMIPIVILYYFFCTTPVNHAERMEEYCSLKQKYILPASAVLGNDADLTHLKELDAHYLESVDKLENASFQPPEQGDAKIYCIEPDENSFINVTAYSPYAHHLYQHMDEITVNPIYYTNTTLMKETTRNKEPHDRIISYANSDLKLNDSNDNITAINDFLIQAFPADDLSEYIGYTTTDPSYPEGLYYFYCIDFSGYNVNLYAMYFSFEEEGVFSSVAYDNMVLYGNDLVQFYNSGEKNLFASFHPENDELRDKLSHIATTLNTIIYNSCLEKMGKIYINHIDYVSDDVNVALLYSCNLTF